MFIFFYFYISPFKNGLQKYTTCPTWPNFICFLLKKITESKTLSTAEL